MNQFCSTEGKQNEQECDIALIGLQSVVFKHSPTYIFTLCEY